MREPYDPHEIEQRWTRRWEETGLHRFDTDAPADRKFYNLVEFPYPSGDGLHVGHVRTYAGADAYGRYQRLRGHEVFQPMGFDSFGINAENYALKCGEHPRTLMERTISNFRRQLSSFGAAWDPSRTVATHEPDYYRWTQWLFCRLHEAGLAYRAEAPVIWCPSCATVLAREQVEDDRCERCGSEITERSMRQWFLRITSYADELVDGLDALDWPEWAKEAQRQWVGRHEGGYRLHDWLISRQRYWGPPIPIVHCVRCGEVRVPDRDLPVLLPEVEDFRPTGTGLSPLASIAEFVETACPTCGRGSRRETDVSDTFFDSSWYFLRYTSTDRDNVAWDPERVARLLPVDRYEGGQEHVRRHHLYARFVCMALNDLGLLPFREPFPSLNFHGLIVLRGAKMSKSRGNVVEPDPYIAEVGADNLRLALLSAGPWQEGGEFSDEHVAGMVRFTSRVWQLVTSPHAAGAGDLDLRPLDRTVAWVERDIEAYKFHTAIARLVELERWARNERERMPGEIWERTARTLVLLLAPFAPHLAEELWARLGGSYSVHEQPWPPYDPDALAEDTVTLAVQIDGRTRDTLEVPAGLTEDEAVAEAMRIDRVREWLGGREVQRIVHVPDRLVNLLTR